MTIRVAVAGATGKMGRLAIELIEASDDLELHAALDSRSSLDEMLGADVALDVTHPAASAGIVEFATGAGIPIVVGTSGWSSERISEIAQFMRGHEDAGAVLFIPNFSIGSVLGTAFATLAARYFDSIEIVEAHHAGKVDSPSGTAVRTAELIGDARAGSAPWRPRTPTSAPAASSSRASRCTACACRACSPSSAWCSAARGRRSPSRTPRCRRRPTSRASCSPCAARPAASGVVVGLDALLDLGLPGAS